MSSKKPWSRKWGIPYQCGLFGAMAEKRATFIANPQFPELLKSV